MKDNTQEPKWYTMAELMKMKFPEKVRHNKALNTIEVDLYGEGEPPYEIDLDTCRDHVELVDWIRHIAGVNGCTADMIWQAIELWGKITGLSVYGH